MAYAYPTGIQHLMFASDLKVRQKRLGFGGNKYEVLTVNGDTILKAKEDGTGLGSLLGGSSRSFHMHIYDMQQNLIFSLRRPYTFGSDKMEVSLNGEVVAVVRQQPTFMTPILHINDANDSMILRLKGDWSEWFFKLQTSDKTCIGSVDKKWGGFLKETFTNQDTYMVKFPQDLDVRLKAAVLGSCVLIDYMYNER